MVAHLANEFLEQLNSSGWVFLNLEDFAVSNPVLNLEEIASSLGSLIPGRHGLFIQRLSPTKPQDAHPASLSAIYGIDEFPLHSDTAHWVEPCRYVVLGCVETNTVSTPTFLADTNKLLLSIREKELLTNTIFHVRNGRNSFYSSILSKMRNFFRFDPGCMIPIGDDGDSCFKIVARLQNEITRVEWCAGSVLVIDNWRMLHGREALRGSDFKRIIIRGLVK